jgi:putative transposase
LKPLEERRMMLDRNDTTLSIVKQCELLDINRSSFYYVPKGENSENLAILRFLDEQYLKTPFFGAKRLFKDLIAAGYSVSLDRLRRLMKLQGWQTIYCTPKTTRVDPAAYKYPYLLRELNIKHKNQVWAIDITYIPMQKGFMYLCAIIDLYTRFVVGWGISNTMTAEWCKDIVNEAINNHGKPCIINSDQGSQFTSETYTSFLKNQDIEISMDGKGRATDNIFIERLWRSVKYENIYLKVYEDGLSLYHGLKQYFKFYNDERRHQSLDYQTPRSCYESQAA